MTLEGITEEPLILTRLKILQDKRVKVCEFLNIIYERMYKQTFYIFKLIQNKLNMLL